MSGDGEMLEWAMSYVERGWEVFPCFAIRDGACSCGDPKCRNPGKHPIPRKGFLAASNDPDMLRRWWRDHPDANIGLPCGPNGLIAFDVDPRNGGDKTISQFFKGAGKFDTLEQISGGNGRHYVYRNPDEAKVKSPGAGVDIKDQGYLIVAPSLHI